MSRNHVFGPVASRRLGISLGVDLVRPKCCSLDCVYCEAGKTTDLTLKRAEYVPATEVIAQLDDVLSQSPKLDFITFSGAGEPTLNAKIGEVIHFVKEKYPQYKLCLLTNGCSFADPEVRAEVRGVDVVVPSLDASNEEEFRSINRPADGITFASLLDGLRDFCAESDAEIDLELFIVPGVNDSDASIARFVEIVRSLKVTKVQLNTLDRPGLEEWVKPSSAENTRRFIAALEPIVPVEAVGPFRYKSEALRDKMPKTEIDCRILELATRRPVTLDDMVVAVGIDAETLKKRVVELVNSGLLSSERQARGEFFRHPNT